MIYFRMVGILSMSEYSFDIPMVGIPKSKNAEWIKTSKLLMRNVERAYKDVMANLKSPFYLDNRFVQNDHIINPDFETNPVFIIGSHRNGPLVLSLVYVFPRYRNAGLATSLINRAKSTFNHFVQVAVTENSTHLMRFYENLGFKSTGKAYLDSQGTPLVDYFWGPKEFYIQRLDDEYLLDYV